MPPAHALRMLLKLEKTRSWRQATGDSDKLSADALDLLDQIFQADIKQRITIEGIKQHAWFNQKLPQQYAEALQRQEQQVLKAVQADQALRAQRGMQQLRALALLPEDPAEEEQQVKEGQEGGAPAAAGQEAAGQEAAQLQGEQQAVTAQLQEQLRQQLQLSQHLKSQRQMMLSRDSPMRRLRVHDSVAQLDVVSAYKLWKQQQQQRPTGPDIKATMQQVTVLLESARATGRQLTRLQLVE
jgi:hypothetical protein